MYEKLIRVQDLGTFEFTDLNNIYKKLLFYNYYLLTFTPKQNKRMYM